MTSQLEVQVAVAKINKYATSESGDTVEVVERPHGGISVVMADGQRSGRSAKAISNIVVRKAISLLAEGIRDGAVARAAHDYLHTQRGGKVSAELNIVSIDLVTRTLVLSRNSRCPILLYQEGAISHLDEPSEAIGIYRNTKPAITELAIEKDITVVVFTDGVWNAGTRQGHAMNLDGLLHKMHHEKRPVDERSADILADAILEKAICLDQGRPRDDATVFVIKVAEQKPPDHIRRLFMRLPI